MAPDPMSRSADGPAGLTDLRNSVAAVLGAARTLRDHPHDLTEDQRRDLLHIIVSQGERLMEMVTEPATRLPRHGPGP